MESVHEEKKPHKCPICDHSFSQKNDLKRHVESVHEGKKKLTSVLYMVTTFHRKLI